MPGIRDAPWSWGHVAKRTVFLLLPQLAYGEGYVLKAKMTSLTL